eukprot:CAMPEP_0202352616 /NCGR_PEP_ID=MMETSP1126-20121109/8731_1 /ASSEMBLY_ACC=CAM_ASM_000457 /TAXON_ID=3047 /ORGANISM="Dunaliella tertiolecta, Strain CCMP1320" /LENGTH=32 /DNA_ID= /DNA_START= /DNA_END= /DNA_ORIENTATION=
MDRRAKPPPPQGEEVKPKPAPPQDLRKDKSKK